MFAAERAATLARTRIVLALLAASLLCVSVALAMNGRHNTPTTTTEDPDMAEGGLFTLENVKRLDLDLDKWDEHEGPPVRYTIKPGETDSVTVVYKDGTTDGPYACGAGSTITYHATHIAIKAKAAQ